MDMWSRVLKRIENLISKPSFQTWFLETTAQIENDFIKISTKNQFAADWLEERYKSLIYNAVRDVTGNTYEIEFSYPNSTQEKSSIKENIFKRAESNLKYGELSEQLEAIYSAVEEQEEKINMLKRTLIDIKSRFAINVRDSSENVTVSEEVQEKGYGFTSTESLDSLLSKVTSENLNREDLSEKGENEYKEPTVDKLKVIKHVLRDNERNPLEGVYGMGGYKDSYSVEVFKQILSEVQMMKNEIQNIESKLLEKMDVNMKQILNAINSITKSRESTD